MQPQQMQFAGFEGIALRADVYGADDAWPVLMMHGGGQTRHAWGNTLAEMLNILAEFPALKDVASAQEMELVARVIAQSLQDRPQALGTLAPKKDGLALDMLSSREFARERAERIRAARQAEPQRTGGEAPRDNREDHDTTHLSVMDAEGNAVALTTSIGPRFGARVASPQLGFFYAHSYRMRSSPEPGARDHTEMTPTIVLHQGKPVLVIGAAGSERIPGAILQVLSNVLDRGMSLREAVRAPRPAAKSASASTLPQRSSDEAGGTRRPAPLSRRSESTDRVAAIASRMPAANT